MGKESKLLQTETQFLRAHIAQKTYMRKANPLLLHFAETVPQKSELCDVTGGGLTPLPGELQLSLLAGSYMSLCISAKGCKLSAKCCCCQVSDWMMNCAELQLTL